MNRKRVQMLRDMMEGIPEKNILLQTYYEKLPKMDGVADCGTVACIAGWAYLYPPFVKLRIYHAESLQEFFDIDYGLFYTRLPHERGTDKQIALRRLDKLLT